MPDDTELRDIQDRAVDCASDGITISDMRLPDAPLVYVNAGFERLTGYSRGEILGKNCRFLQGEAAGADAVAEIRAAIAEGREFSGELLNFRKDGTPFWNLLSLTPLRDASGAVTHYVGVQSDITARVRAAAALEASNRRLAEANRRMRQSLEAAVRVQQALLPRKLPECRRVEFAWRLTPCDELAGDILNIFRLDDTHVGVYLLDVTGHGTASALRAVAASQMLSADIHAASLLWEQCEQTGKYCLAPPPLVAGKLNRHFPWDAEVGLFFTLVYGILDLETHQFRYVCAGHPPPLHFSGPVENPVSPSTGLPVGLAPSAYEEATVQMTPGDTLVLYSDGITDVLDGEKRPFGRTRLARHFIEGAGAPLGDTLDGLMASLETWRGGAAFADDLSLLAFRIRSE